MDGVLTTILVFMAGVLYLVLGCALSVLLEPPLREAYARFMGESVERAVLLIVSWPVSLPACAAAQWYWRRRARFV